ncbi:MAG: SIMPL domain-containing protein [Patescibacteria group bacterium]
MSKKLKNKIIMGLIVSSFILFVVHVFDLDWGSINLSQKGTVTVTGEAKGQEASQVARFSATVTKTNDSKEVAVDGVNQGMEKIVEQVKSFGIKDQDLKTMTISISQDQEDYYEGDRRKSRPGQWRVSNSLEITLRDVDQSSQLANLLAESGATNVWGPNFYLDDTNSMEDSLMEEAIKDARQKAEAIAKVENRKVKKAISISEGYSDAGIRYAMESGGGGAPMEPGSSTVQKTVTVVFELD